MVWLTIGGAVGVLDYWRDTKKDGTTISENLRVLTATTFGKVAFVSGLLGFAKHILSPK